MEGAAANAVVPSVVIVVATIGACVAVVPRIVPDGWTEVGARRGNTVGRPRVAVRRAPSTRAVAGF